MKYIEIIPEVIVGLGERTVFKEKKAPFMTIITLHINLEDWLGDDLMTNSNNFIVTEKLKIGLEKSKFTGFTFENMEITKDEYFDNNYQLNKELPIFYWMKINGEMNIDFIHINPNNSRLMLSEELYNWLKKNYSTKFLSEDNLKVDDFMKRFIESQKG